MGAGATSLSKEQAEKYKEFDAAKWEALTKDDAGKVGVDQLLPFAPAVTCYTADTSICSMICRVAAEEHGVPNVVHTNIDIECAMENYEPSFIAIQPKMTVPCMKYGDDVIGDSKDIMYYLSEKHPDAALYPAEQKEAIDTFIDMFYSRFGQIARFTFGNWIRKSDKIKEFIGRGKNEKSAEKLEKAIAEHPEWAEQLAKKLESKKKFDFCAFMLSANLEEMDASMKEVLDAMEAALEKTAYVAGDSYTLADVVATAFLARVHVVKDETMFGPRTAACWNDKYKTRPSFQKAYCLWKWDQSLMFKQIEVFADGGDPESVKWTGPPSVIPG